MIADKRAEIIKFIKEDRKKKWISKHLGVSQFGLYKYLKKHPITDEELNNTVVIEEKTMLPIENNREVENEKEIKARKAKTNKPVKPKQSESKSDGLESKTNSEMTMEEKLKFLEKLEQEVIAPR